MRFDKKTSKNTSLLYATDGILLKETLGDPVLSKYGIIMVDEAHERTVNSDVLLALVKKIAKKRKELKIIIASATLDAILWRDYFNINNGI